MITGTCKRIPDTVAVALVWFVKKHELHHVLHVGEGPMGLSADVCDRLMCRSDGRPMNVNDCGRYK